MPLQKGLSPPTPFKSLLNDTTWGSQVVITIETSLCSRTFDWPHKMWIKGAKGPVMENFTKLVLWCNISF